MKRWLRRIGLTLLAVVAGVGLYVATAFALVYWPVNAPPADAPKVGAEIEAEVEAFVLSNDVHTDLVLPIRSTTLDWRSVFSLADFPAPPQDAEFVVIGWGDREFYLNTPTWADVTVSRTLGALFGSNSSVLHVSYLRRAQLGQGAYRLALSQAQYARLVDYVRASLPPGRAEPIANAHYDHQDAFYDALGSYNLFETCNTWTGRALRRAGVTASRWTPFDVTVTWHLQRAH